MKQIINIVIILIGLIYSSVKAQWVQTNEPSGQVDCFLVDGTNLYVSTSVGLFVSSDLGSTWQGLWTGDLLPSTIWSLCKSGGNMLAGLNGDGVYYSVDHGKTWTQTDLKRESSVITRVYSLTSDGPYVFAGTDRGVFISSNYGVSWTFTGFTNTPVYEVEVLPGPNGTDLVFASLSAYIGPYRSTDYGSIWISDNSGLSYPCGDYFMHLGSFDNYIFCTTFNGVYRSEDFGLSWKLFNIGPQNRTVDFRSFAASNSKFFVGTWGAGVFLSIDDGESWTPVNEGLFQYFYINTMSICGSFLFLASGDFIWKRPIDEMVTAVEITKKNALIEPSLQQNYPNPFNPSTTISFSLPHRAFVTLKVFDLLGREISTIVSEEMDAGRYSRYWRALDNASGVYFYRLQAGNFTETKKLIIIK